jgi:hypothetical protein
MPVQDPLQNSHVPTFAEGPEKQCESAGQACFRAKSPSLLEPTRLGLQFQTVGIGGVRSINNPTEGDATLPISSFEQKRVSKLLREYCDQRIPPHIRDEVQLGFRFEGNNVVLYERRPAWNRPGEWVEPSVAKFRFFVGRQGWALYWRDRNGRWKRYDLVAPSRQFEDLLEEVDADPTGIFWG